MNNRTREQLSWLSAVIRANDREGAVYLSESDLTENEPVLVVEDGSGYASRIYRADGYLVEDYAQTGSELDPEDALKIGRTDLFLVDLDGDAGGLHVTTDEGSIFLQLRCAKAG